MLILLNDTYLTTPAIPYSFIFSDLSWLSVNHSKQIAKQGPIVTGTRFP
jgi:hypothetical protein